MSKQIPMGTTLLAYQWIDGLINMVGLDMK